MDGTPTLEALCSRIRSGHYKRIIVMAGAGISVAAGIPDFRTPGSGLYDNLEKYSLPRPQAVFEMEYFHQNPQPFFSLAKDLYPLRGRFAPTKAHYFISLLAQKGYLLRCYSQVYQFIHDLYSVLLCAKLHNCSLIIGAFNMQRLWCIIHIMYKKDCLLFTEHWFSGD